MSNKALDNLPLFDIFEQWQTEYKLHLTDYEAFRQVFLHTDWCADELTLVEVCAMLWLKKEADRKIFEESCGVALEKLKNNLQNQIQAKTPATTEPIQKEITKPTDDTTQNKQEPETEIPKVEPEPPIKKTEKPTTQKF